MKQNRFADMFTQKFLKSDVPAFKVGDTIKVHSKVIEGEKERVQVFTGTVIARKGSGVSETFTLHRVAYGCGMERDFPIHSPRIVKIELERSGKVRKSKLYYLRDAVGKAARIEEDIDAKVTAIKGKAPSTEAKSTESKAE